MRSTLAKPALGVRWLTAAALAATTMIAAAPARRR